MRKPWLLPILLLIPAVTHAQGYSSENYSNGVAGTVPTQTQLFSSWYGYRGTGFNGNGCDVTTQCVILIGANNASTGALTIQNQSASVCGSVPPNSGGSSAKILDYNTALGGGHNNIYMDISFPQSGGTTQSNVTLYASWFCSNIPATAAFGTTFDDFVVIGSGSQLSNFTCNGPGNTVCHWGLEGGGGTINYTPGTWVQLVGQYVKGGTCSDLVGFTDCVRLCEYDINGQSQGCVHEGTAGGAFPVGLTLGNLNPATFPAGTFHVQHMNAKVCYLGCTAAEFNTFQIYCASASFGCTPTPLSDGILTPGRATDYTKAGFPGDVLPDAGWASCGSLAPGTYTGAAIGASLAACALNTHLDLQSGTFNVSGEIIYPSTGFRVLRGQKDGSSHIVHTGTGSTGCGQNSSVICLISSDRTFLGQPAPNTCTVSGSLAQGSTQITLANRGGNCPASISTTTPTMLFLDACDTGFSGDTCGTGSAIDNAGDFRCGAGYNGAGPTGCSADGGEPARPNRNTLEAHVATSVSGSTYTITPPIISANYASLNNPQVSIFQPVVEVGVEYVSIDNTAAGSPQEAIEGFNCYKCWVYGVRTINTPRVALNFLETDNNVLESNYIYRSTGTCPSCYGIRPNYSGNMLVSNNILQQIGSPIFDDGSTTGDVYAYNFCAGSSLAPTVVNTGAMADCYDEHAGNYYNLYEGNIGNQVSCDDIHGTCDHVTMFRNFLTGWDSEPAHPVGQFTNAIEHFAFSRFHNAVGNVTGTPGYHNAYSGSPGGATTVMSWGGGPGGVTPTDTRTLTTSLVFANYDTQTATVRFCGNARDSNFATTCASVSEVPFSLSTFPAFIPVKGDTSVGEDVLPPSFVYTSRPSWYPPSVPFPGIGPDISGGNVGQCTGTINTVGQMAKVPALTNAQCPGTSLAASQWAGHVNANPAMLCALNVMGMPPDGSGSVLTFNTNTCYPPSGTTSPIVVFSPTSFDFGSIPINTTASQSFTLTNGGTATLTISNVAFVGSDPTVFSQTNNCGASVLAGTFCTINVTFHPIFVGAKSASLTFTTNAADSPESIPLTGTATSTGAAAISLSATSVPFLPQRITVPIVGPPVVVTSNGTAPLVFGSTALSLSGPNAADFSFAGSPCTNNLSLSPASTCNILVTYTPSVLGNESATLTLVDNAPDSPQNIFLTGTGIPLLPASTPMISWNITGPHAGCSLSAGPGFCFASDGAWLCPGQGQPCMEYMTYGLHFTLQP